MKLESLISEMMSINVTSRLWHWATDIAQHHTTFEQFLTQNEQLTDSLVESALGNEINISFDKILIQNLKVQNYSIKLSIDEIKTYRKNVFEMKQLLEKSAEPGGAELISILDDVTELASKTLYLLKLK